MNAAVRRVLWQTLRRDPAGHLPQADPSDLLAAALDHAMALPLGRLLERTQEPHYQSLRDYLRDYRATAAKVSLLLAGQARSVAAIFEDARINAVPPNGPAAIAALYGSLAEADPVTTEWWVPAPFLDRATTALREHLGYVPRRAAWKLETLPFLDVRSPVLLHDNKTGTGVAVVGIASRPVWSAAIRSPLAPIIVTAMRRSFEGYRWIDDLNRIRAAGTDFSTLDDTGLAAAARIALDIADAALSGHKPVSRTAASVVRSFGAPAGWATTWRVQPAAHVGMVARRAARSGLHVAIKDGLPRLQLRTRRSDASDALADRTFGRFEQTDPVVAERMAQLAGIGPGDVVVDLGCGDGTLLLAAARQGASGRGVEIDATLVRRARARIDGAGVADRILIQHGDAMSDTLADATVVMLYAKPAATLRLRPVLEEVVRRGGRIVAHHFDLGDWKPDIEEQVATPAATRTIRLWETPSS